MNTENLLFAPMSTSQLGPSQYMDYIEESSGETVKRMQNATKLASFDFKIYDELKEIKKELREKRALRNLIDILKEEEEEEGEEKKPKEEEGDDEFSMDISMDYDNRDYDYYNNDDDEVYAGQY